LLRGKLPDEDREAIRSRLENPELEDMPRGNLLFGLAHVSDASGDYAEAARCLEKANTLAREQRHGQVRRYDPSEHIRYVDQMIEGFTPDLFARLAGDDTRQPVFVFGMSSMSPRGRSARPCDPGASAVISPIAGALEAL
jgi:hypothetical protein